MSLIRISDGGGRYVDCSQASVAAKDRRSRTGQCFGCVPVVEYHHDTFDHYFVTASKAEIAALDTGAFPGWARTGQSF